MPEERDRRNARRQRRQTQADEQTARNMSAASGFHRSAHDNTRSYVGSRTLGGDRSRSTMSDILGGVVEVAQPPPRQQSQVSTLFNDAIVPAHADQRRLRIGNPAAPMSHNSAMNDVMHGVAVLDATRGPKPNARYNSGSSMLSALRPETNESDTVLPPGADPFAHHRVRPKAASTVARDTGPQLVVGNANVFDAGATAQPPMDPFHQALAGVHRDLCQLAASTPRDPSTGALEDYRVLLKLLAERGLPLDADACGTLIAHFDVNHSISYDDFIDLVSKGLMDDGAAPAQQAAAPAPAPQPQRPPQPAAPRVAPTGTMGQYDPSQWTTGYQPAAPQAPTDMAAATKQLLGRGSVAASASTNFDLARALNGGLGQHSRRSDPEYMAAVGKSSMMR